MSTQIDSLSIRIESNSRGATTAIDGLVAALGRLKTAANVGGADKGIKKIGDAVNKGMSGVPSAFNKGAKAVDTFTKATDKSAASSDKLGSALSRAAGSVLQFVGNAIGIHQVGQALANTLAQAREWDGISARFAEGFGDQVDEAYAHVQKLSEALYINDQVFMQYSSNFATLARGFGVAETAIKDMSIGLTELAYDIYAKNNDFYTFEEALMAVRSALVGEVEPIRLAGISITEATLKEVAANNGITKSVENMTEAEKALLRYKAMVDQAYSSGTVGTYIKEIGTVEGSSRALAQQLKGLAQAIGSLVMPAIAAVLPYFQALISLATKAVYALASLFGFTIKAPSWSSGLSGATQSANSATGALQSTARAAESVGDASSTIGKTTKALDKAGASAKKLKDYMMGFDELNVIRPPEESSGGGGGGGVGGGGISLEVGSLWTDEMIAAADLKAEEIAGRIQKFLQPVADAIKAINFEPLISSAKRLWEAVKPFAATIGQGLYWFLLNVLIPLAGYTIENIIPAFLNAVAAALEWVTPQLQEFGKWAVKNKEHIATVAVYAAALFGAFKLVSFVSTAVSAFSGFSGIVLVAKKVASGLLMVIQALVVSFNAGGGGLGGALSVVKTLFSGLLGVVTKVVSAAFSPLGAVVVVVAATAMVLAKNWDKVVEVFKTFAEKIDLPGKFEAIKTALAPLMEKLAGLEDLFTVIGTVGAGIVAIAMGAIGGAFNAVVSMIAPLIDAVGGLIDILAGLGSFIVSVFTGDWNKAWESIQLIWDGIVGLFGGLWNAVVAGITGFVQGVIDWFTSLWDTLVGHSIVPDTINSIIDWFLSLPGAILDTISAFVASVIEFFSSLWTSIQTAWAGVSTWFSELFSGAWTGIQTAWSGVGTWFSDLWTGISTAWSGVSAWFGNLFSDAWTGIQTAWASVGTWFSDLWTTISTAWSGVTTWFSDLFSSAWSGIQTAFDGTVIGDYFAAIWGTVEGIFSVVKDVLSGNFSGAWNAITEIFSGWSTYFRALWTLVQNAFSSVGTWFSDLFSGAWTSIKNVFSGWGSFFSGLWDTISTTFSNLGTSIGSAVSDAITAGINGVLKWVQDTINGAIDIINKAIKLINKIPGVEVSTVKKVTIPMLASGGFVDEGQMFIAREAGPEMVGSMGGRTAVANNDQIVEGIYQGVYAAVRAAMSENTGNGNVPINVYLDGKQITASVEKRQRERGVSIMTGGVNLGY